ncbi:MAG: hypothetical protein Q27BPR15_09325 [Rhodobacter sp. CACIA14H1]|nr:MAG: hypothetical protein Q27BPR15_09325 [Rhodobacter sp. CACIA14H1]
MDERLDIPAHPFFHSTSIIFTLSFFIDKKKR